MSAWLPFLVIVPMLAAVVVFLTSQLLRERDEARFFAWLSDERLRMATEANKEVAKLYGESDRQRDLLREAAEHLDRLQHSADACDLASRIETSLGGKKDA